MSTYEYQAIDASGRTVKGVISAESARSARRDIRARKLVPLAVAESRAREQDSPAPGLRRGRMDARQLMTFTRQMAALMDAGLPLEEALSTLAGQSDTPAARKIILSVRSGLAEGLGLARAMGSEHRSFPPVYRALVAAGEASGELQRIFSRLAGDLERRIEFRSRVTSALVYPAALAATAVMVIGILLVLVLPRLADQFASMGQDLPLLTRGLLGLAEGLVNWGPAGIAGLLLGGVLAWRILQKDTIRLRFDARLLRVPVLGHLLSQAHGAAIARTLGAMISGGMPVVDGLHATAKTVRNRSLRQGLEQAAGAVREGASLGRALKAVPGLPPVMTHMAAVGERSSQVGPMLDRAAGYLEQDMDSFMKSVLSLLEPAIILFMGGVVALIVLSIMLPIMQLNTIGLM